MSVFAHAGSYLVGCSGLWDQENERVNVKEDFVFGCVRLPGIIVVFFETRLLGLGKISYIALGLMRNGLVFRTTGFCFTHNG